VFEKMEEKLENYNHSNKSPFFTENWRKSPKITITYSIDPVPVFGSDSFLFLRQNPIEACAVLDL
jgi:hypothetical protein